MFHVIYLILLTFLSGMFATFGPVLVLSEQNLLKKLKNGFSEQNHINEMNTEKNTEKSKNLLKRMQGKLAKAGVHHKVEAKNQREMMEQSASPLAKAQGV